MAAHVGGRAATKRRWSFWANQHCNGKWKDNGRNFRSRSWRPSSHYERCNGKGQNNGINGNGEYSFTFLTPGTYDVAATAKDFQPMVRQGVAVQAGQLVSIDFQLKVGAITQTETVSAQAVALNTESSHQLQNLTNLEATQLPDSKLDWTNLLIMGTGISKVVGLQGAGGVGGIVMNGMSSSAMNVTIDGTNSSADPELPTFGFYGGMNIINQLDRMPLLK